MKHIFLLIFMLACNALSAQLIDTTLISDYACCLGNSVQTQQVTPIQAGCSYLWSPTTGVSNPTDAEPIITPPFTTFYERRIICGIDTSYDYAMITVNSAPTIVWGYPDTMYFCQYESPTTIGFDKDFINQPGSPLFLQGYTYQWNTGATTDSVLITQTGLYSLNFIAADSSLCDAFAGQVYVIFDPCTSIENPENEDIIVYPNPANEFISIVSSEKIASISLFDMTGKRGYFAEKTDSINVSTFAKGMYILEVITSKGKVVKKVVVE